MEAEEAADRGLVLAPFRPLDGRRGVCGLCVWEIYRPALSAPLTFKETSVQSPWSRPRRLMHLSTEPGARPHNKTPKIHPGDL